MVKEMPKIEKMERTEADSTALEAAINETGGAEKTLSGATGGESMAHAQGTGESVKMKLDEVKAMYPNTPEQAEAPVKPALDTSFLKAHIDALKNEKVNFFKRALGGNTDAIELFTKGLRKIEDPRGQFADQFMEAYTQGGEEFALKYAKAIGNGELVKPVDGVLMMSDKRSADAFFPH